MSGARRRSPRLPVGGADADVVVIGAGYGGIALAALLADRGHSVAVVDRGHRPGGKTQTVERGGWRYEMFGAVGIPGHGSRFHELVERLGIEQRAPFVIPDGDIAGIRYLAADRTWRASLGPAQQSADPLAMDRLRATFGVDDADLERFGTLFLDALTTEGAALDALDDVDMLQWIRRYDLPEPLVSQLAVTMNMLFVVAVDRLAASEGVFTLRQLALGGAGRYHVGGYGRVAEVCGEVVVERGGRLLMGSRVRRIAVERGRVVGVDTDDGPLRARVVVSNAGIQPTVLGLGAADHLPGDYVQRVRELEPSWGLAGTRYLLSERVFEAALTPVFSDTSWLDTDRFARMVAGDWPEVPVIAIDSPSELDPGLVPAGHQIAATQVFVPADATPDFVREANRRAEVVLDELWPGFRRHLVRAEPYGPRQVGRLTRDSVVDGQGGEAVGLAQVVGQCGRSRPDPRTPLPGLWLVGADAGGRGAGTHMAVDSAFVVSELVDAELRGA